MDFKKRFLLLIFFFSFSFSKKTLFGLNQAGHVYVDDVYPYGVVGECRLGSEIVDFNLVRNALKSRVTRN